MFGTKKQSIDELLSGHEYADDTQFRKSLEQMMRDNPQRYPSDLLFIATAIYSTTKETMATLEKARASIIAEEHWRIREIVGYGLDNNCWRDALNLALTTELSTADAIEILSSGAGARPN